jgi:hypothetical protein
VPLNSQRKNGSGRGHRVKEKEKGRGRVRKLKWRALKWMSMTRGRLHARVC